MEKKFIFTAPENCIREYRGTLRISIYGVRNVGEDYEELSITVITRTNAPAGVVCKFYRNSELISREEEHSTDTMGLCKKVKKYIDDLEK